MDRDRVVVAEILRPRGNRGEVLARSQTDVPGRLETLKRAQARLGDRDVEIEIEKAWQHRGEWVLKFAGVDSIDDAERFRGADIWVPATERGKLAAGEYFQSDLIGYAVVDAATGAELGTVQAFEQYGGPPLMDVGMAGREVLIPFVQAMCKVDLTERKITVDVPQGLLEL